MHTHRNLIRSLAACAALALVLSAAPARASRYDESGGNRWDRAANGRLVDVQVLVEGQAAPLYFAPGRWDRHYFQALAAGTTRCASTTARTSAWACSSRWTG